MGLNIKTNIWRLALLVILSGLCLPKMANAESRRGLSNGSISLSQLQELPGTFSRLRKVGNSLVEFTTDAFGNPQVRSLFINNAGQLLGATTQDTIRQVKEFYLANFDLFKGAASNVVSNFLRASGAAQASRGFVVDLGSSVIPKEDLGKGNVQTVKYAQGKEDKVKLAALNFLINTVSQSQKLFTVSPNLVQLGRVGVNLSQFMRPEAIALLTNNNPYACSGTGSEPFRLDFMISRAMDPDVYYQLTGSPKKFDQLLRQFGVNENRRDNGASHIVIAGPPGEEESVVGRHPQRMLGFRAEGNVVGGDAFVSYDNRYNLPPGVQSESADTFRNGIDTSFEASESIFTKPNGFLSFYLANNPGKDRQRSAPVEFAQNTQGGALTRREGHSSDVSAPIGCLVCHANGMLGGGISLKTGKLYTENRGRIQATQNFFTTNAIYNARAKRTGTIFRNAMVASGSFIPDPNSPVAKAFPGETPAASLLPDFVGEYNAPLSVETAAKELGVSSGSLAGLLRTNAQGKVSRKQFESSFCALKQQLGGGGALASQFQRPIQGTGSSLGVRASSVNHL